jgi:DNA-binding cell septation regulator SpoVG
MSFEKRKADGFMTKQMHKDITTYQTGYIDMPKDSYTLEELKDIVKSVEKSNEKIKAIVLPEYELNKSTGSVQRVGNE